METSKEEKKTVARRTEVRSLKIQPKFRGNRWSQTIAPEIKLCGKWLEEMGFSCGKRVAVTVMY